jgi:hypothetical protein
MSKGKINDSLEVLTSHSFTEWLAKDPSLHYECVDQCNAVIEENLRLIATEVPDSFQDIVGPAVLNIASSLAALELSYLKDDIEGIIGKGSDPRFQSILDRINEAIEYQTKVSEDAFQAVNESVNMNRYGFEL